MIGRCYFGKKLLIFELCEGHTVFNDVHITLRIMLLSINCRF